MARNTRATNSSAEVEAYIAHAPVEARRMLTKMRWAIRASVPRDASEIISYRMPAFRRNGVLVWYGAFADHVSLFPTGSILGRFKHELVGFKTSKGTVQFPLGKPLPIALIKRIVKARVAEHQRQTGR